MVFPFLLDNLKQWFFVFISFALAVLPVLSYLLMEKWFDRGKYLVELDVISWKEHRVFSQTMKIDLKDIDSCER